MSQSLRARPVPPIALPVADLAMGAPCFETPDGFDAALRIGAFLATIPANLDIGPGLAFCNSYSEPRVNPDDLYRGHREHGHPLSKLGYEDRPDQVEQLQLENHLWHEYLPREVAHTLDFMRVLTVAILNATFARIGVSGDDRRRIAKVDKAEGASWCHTTMNHYRTGLANRAGIFEHTDSGFITLIYSDSPGLEIFDNGIWRLASHRRDCFTVNYGASIGALTERLANPVTAVLHRVPELDPSGPQRRRSSFTVYLGPDYKSDMMTYDADGALVSFGSFREFSLEQARRQRYEFHARL
jgi:hypothetical protein